MKRTLCACLCALAAARAGAEVTEPVLLQFAVDNHRVEVRPEGDAERAFVVDPQSAELVDGRWHLGSRMTVARDTLYIGGRAVPADRLGRMEVEREGDGVKVTIYDAGARSRGPLRTNRTGLADMLLVAGGEFVRGYVLSFGGHVRVEGEVNRSVVTLGGDVVVAPGGVVRGSVVALGGDVHKDEQAVVYGDLFSGQRSRFRPRRDFLRERNVVDFRMALDYNRVTGALPWASWRTGPTAGYAPSLLVDVGYAFESELWHYRLGLGRSDARGPRYYAGALRETQNDDRLRIEANENLLFALLFREDYRDYYFGEGVRAEAGWGWGRNRFVRVGYQNELLRPLAAHPRLFSLFGGDPFSPNYAQLVRAQDPRLGTDFQGRLVVWSADARYRYPYFDEPRTGVWDLQLEAQASSPDLHSDYDYTRLVGSALRQQPLWGDQSFRMRVVGGSSGGELPATRLFYLGGLGSLPGYDYKEFVGDRFWLANAEYVWDMDGYEIFAAVNGGQIGTGPGLSTDRIRLDLGLGVSVENVLRVQIAQAAERNRDPLVTVRFSRPF